MQTIIIGVLALIAAAYLTNLIYKSFTSSACESGCAKCSATDVNALIESFEKKKAKD